MTFLIVVEITLARLVETDFGCGNSGACASCSMRFVLED
jgi:ferredoxin